jgi:hypothetical protein
MNTYKNRYGDQFTFTLDSDKNILWEGDFNYCRIGYPNDYLKAYDKYCKDHIENFYNGERMSLDHFKKAVHKYDEDKREYTHVKYLNLVTSNKDIIDMVDPSGGPYIGSGDNMGRYGEEFKQMVVERFETIDTGYKIIVK